MILNPFGVVTYYQQQDSWMGSQQSKNVTGVPSPLPSDGRGEGQGEVRAEG